MKQLLSIVFISLFVLVLSGFLMAPDGNDYQKSWDEVESYVKKGLPRSALKLIDNIYTQAKAEGNEAQSLKALIYRVSLEAQYEEEPSKKAIALFTNDLGSASKSERALLQSLLAELYQKYFQRNRWAIYDRAVVVDDENADIASWDAVRFQNTIRDLYLSSVENSESLQAIKLESFKELLVEEDSSDFVRWPSLYDLLAHRALAYFSYTKEETNQLGFSFHAKDSALFSPVSTFVNLDLDAENEEFSGFEALILYQYMLRFHLENGNTEALVDLDLERLSFINDNYPDAEDYAPLYIRALAKLRETHKESPVFMPISIALAKCYQDNYIHLQRNEEAANANNTLLALTIYEEALSAYPNHSAANVCKNAINSIKEPGMNFTIDAVNLPDKAFPALLQFKNMEEVHFRIVAVDPDKLDKKRNMGQFSEGLFEFMHDEAIANWSQSLPLTTDYHQHSMEIKMPALPMGHYIVFASDNASFQKTANIKYQLVWSSSLSYISRDLDENGSTEIFVLNRETGKPVAEVDLEVFSYSYENRSRRRSYELVGSYETNEFGFVKLEGLNNMNRGSYLIKFSKGKDRFHSVDHMNWYMSNGKRNHIPKTYFFTDRAIYRPGQTVYFKGIMVEKSGNDVVIRPNTPTEVEFRDANYKVVSKQNFISNEMASFHGSFVIPIGSLNGTMTVKNETNNISFEVEAYKRPTFQLTFDSIEGRYQLGDQISVNGRAEDFAGSSVSNANVKYRVTRYASIPRPYYGYRTYNPMPRLSKEIEIAHGEVLTEADGSFPISFMATAQEGLSSELKPVYSYTIYAEVTDITGEVQHSQTSIQVGNQTVKMEIILPDGNKVNQETKNPIQLNASNYSGLPLQVEATISLFLLTPPDRLLNDRNWEKPEFYQLAEADYKSSFTHLPYKNEQQKTSWPRKEILTNSISFHGKTNLLTSSLPNLETGEYLLRAETQDKEGETILVEEYVTIYSTTDKSIAGNRIYWATLSKNHAEPGESVQLLLGSMAKKSQILYEIHSGDKLLERKWVSLNRGQKTIDIPVHESDRGNLYISTYMVRFNQAYSDKFVLTVPFSNKKLDLAIETFRDHLSPGREEEWRVTIKGAQGENLVAELLAGMYDASLDQFAENKWSMNLYTSKNPPDVFSLYLFAAKQAQTLYHTPLKQFDVYVKAYPSINWFDGAHAGSRVQHYAQKSFVDGLQVEGEEGQAAMAADEIEVVSRLELSEDLDFVEPPAETPIVNVPMRSNFQETAFFFPQLKTDSAGQVVFSFTTPDALTEWKVMLLGHTKTLEVGTLEKRIKASKELMVMANSPRFVRQGDQLEFTAKVINFTDKQAQVQVWIEFYNALTNKGVDILSGKQQKSKSLTITARQNAQVSWVLDIPDDIGVLAYRIKAKGADFTDGEEKSFPVLSNRMLVTETMPMYINANQKKEFRFERLLSTSKFMGLSTRKDYRFTFEFTANPAWYAIQALPSLSMPKYESSDNLFRVFYSNSLSSYILNSNPAIKQVFESWKNSSPEAFYSNLQKNEALKAVLLQATPWVLEAENEAEQKRRIGILFDLNRLAGEKSAIMGKLLQRQLSSGAWPWFKGGIDNRYISQSIVTGLAKLHNKGVLNLQEDGSTMSMLKRAVRYLDNRIKQDYEDLLKQNPKELEKNQISSSQIQYLYARSLILDIIPIHQSTKLAFDFYKAQMKKYWLKQSNYLQAMSAVSLHRLGHRNEAEAIIRSLRERAIVDDEMGMYWRQNTSWYWYQAPIESHTMIMAAFQEVQADNAAVEQMKTWLLKQKQTTHWNTSSATAEAVFALLFSGDELIGGTKIPEIHLGGEVLEITKTDDLDIEAGSGYFKTTWNADDFSAELGNITINNTNHHIGWGAAYWQYFEDLDKISEAQSPLSINKKLYLEQQSDRGPEMKELDTDDVLKPGDKVLVRLIIKSDRSMEYVHLSDMRATAFEPVEGQSGYQYSAGLSYYKNTTDVSTDFFIRYLNKGTYVLEYPLFVTQSGTFSNGIASIQCLYAPEFAAHSSGTTMKVE